MATITKGENPVKPYTVKWRDADRRQRERSFARRAEAQDFKTTVEHGLREGTYVDPRNGSVPFGTYATQWIDLHPGAAGTKKNYRSVLSKHIDPEIGSVLLSRLSRDHVRRLLLETIPAKELSTSTCQTARTVIVAVLAEAVRGHKVHENVASGIRLPAVSERAEFTMATRAQLDKITAGMTARWSLAVTIMRGCGLRIGEVLAVRSDSVSGNVLRVEEQVLGTGKRGPLKHRKPGEFRDVPLPKYAADAIALHVKTHGDGYLFPEFADGKRRPEHWRDEFMRQAKLAGLPASFTPHDLRHCYASACLAGRIPITDLSRWLGHRDINLTHRVYGHMVESATDDAIKILDRDWAGRTGPIAA